MSRSFLHRIAVVIGLLAAIPGWAQETDSTRTKKDTTRTTVMDETKNLQSIHPENEADSSRYFYEKLKRTFSKTRITRELYRLLFREPYQNAPSQKEEPKKNPYERYNGKFIGEVQIKKLEPFGARVNDTLREPAGWLERTGNAIHTTTRAAVIRSTLLFEKGDRVNSFLLDDNERILRQLPYILDARIFLMPRESDRDTVDVLVLTQDAWAITGSLGLNLLTSGSANINSFNIFGLGHELLNRVSYDSDTLRGWGYRGYYRVPFIGRTFISGELRYINEWNNNSYGLRLQRDFLAPTTKWAGGLEVSQNRLVGELVPFSTDTVQLRFTYAYNLGDFWLGRAFPLGFGDDRFRARTRLIVAGRVTARNYYDRPEVRSDTNQLYQNRLLSLVSVGVSNRSYYQDVLITGFGRTEDVPYGWLFSVTGGTEGTEFGQRHYGGIKASYGRYYNNFGYMVGTLDVGSFFRDRKLEQGVVQANLNYFSRLFVMRSLRIRQFVNLRYTEGINRFGNEYIDISSTQGIRGLSSTFLRGTKSLVCNLETVFFTPLNILGFQIATFAYADLGMVSAANESLLSTRIYQGYGVGLRVRNENLLFNTFQFRLSYYPNIPNNGSPLRTLFSGLVSLPLNDFSINAPTTIPFNQY